MTSVGVMASAVVTGSCAAVLREPFDNLTAWGLTGSPAIVAGGRTGKGLELDASTERTDYQISAVNESATLTVGVAFKTNNLASAIDVVSFVSDGGVTLHNVVTVQANGSLIGKRGSAGLGTATAVGLVVTNTWYYLEVQVTLHDTTGSMVVRLNGTQVLNYTNVDTSNGGTKTVYDQVRLRHGALTTTMLFDDMYITSGAGCPFQGDQAITACTDVLTEPFTTLANWSGGTLVAGRNGNAMQVSNTAHSTYPLGVNQSSTVTVGFAVNVSALGFAPDIIAINSDANATTHTRLVVLNTGALSVWQGAGLNLGSSAAGVIAANTWNYVEIQATLHDTLGAVTVRVSGITVLALTGVDTKNAGTKTVYDTIDCNPNTSSTNVQWDDMYVSTGSGCSFKGDINPPPPLTSPLSITWHSALWASDPSWTPPADGAAVSSWRNAGTSASDATQATSGSRPVYRASFANLNSKPAVQFDGIDDYLSTASASIAQPNHVFIVAWLDPTHSATPTICDSVPTTTRGQIRNTGTGGSIVLYAGGASASTTGGGIDGKFALAVLFSGASSAVRMNATPYTLSANPGSHDFSQLRVGADCLAGAPYKGAIAFIGVKDTALTVQETADLETWARSFYGTP